MRHLEEKEPSSTWGTKRDTHDFRLSSFLTFDAVFGQKHRFSGYSSNHPNFRTAVSMGTSESFGLTHLNVNGQT